MRTILFLGVAASTWYAVSAQDPLKTTRGNYTIFNLFSDNACQATPTTITPTASADNCTAIPQGIYAITAKQLGYNCQAYYFTQPDCPWGARHTVLSSADGLGDCNSPDSDVILSAAVYDCLYPLPDSENVAESASSSSTIPDATTLTIAATATSVQSPTDSTISSLETRTTVSDATTMPASATTSSANAPSETSALPSTVPNGSNDSSTSLVSSFPTIATHTSATPSSTDINSMDNTSSTTATVTSTPSASTSPSDNTPTASSSGHDTALESKEGLTRDQKIALAICVFAGVTLFAGFVGWCIKRRRYLARLQGDHEDGDGRASAASGNAPVKVANSTSGRMVSRVCGIGNIVNIGQRSSGV